MCSNWNIGAESVVWKITIIKAAESRCKLGNRKWKCVCVLEKEPMMTTPTTKITCRLIIIITVLPHTTAICYNKTKISIYKHFRSNAVNSDREHTDTVCVCIARGRKSSVLTFCTLFSIDPISSFTYSTRLLRHTRTLIKLIEQHKSEATTSKIIKPFVATLHISFLWTETFLYACRYICPKTVRITRFISIVQPTVSILLYVGPEWKYARHSFYCNVIWPDRNAITHSAVVKRKILIT